MKANQMKKEHTSSFFFYLVNLCSLGSLSFIVSESANETNKKVAYPSEEKFPDSELSGRTMLGF